MNSALVHCSQENSQKLRLLFMNSTRTIAVTAQVPLKCGFKKKKKRVKHKRETQNVYPNPALLFLLPFYLIPLQLVWVSQVLDSKIFLFGREEKWENKKLCLYKFTFIQLWHNFFYIVYKKKKTKHLMLKIKTNLIYG